MVETQALSSHIVDHESKASKATESTVLGDQKSCSWLKRYKWWVEMAIYTLFVVCGCAIATLLGRLYYAEGGKSKWMGSLVQTAGFPILLPLFFISSNKYQHQESGTNQPSPLILASIYASLGLFIACICMLYSIGLMYLPVSTFAVICASQLGFNALFSYFLSGQNFTPYILNSIVLLTISSILLVFQHDSGDSVGASKKNYMIGFLCTVVSAISCALLLAITQLVCRKVIKKQSFRAILDLTFYENLVATSFILIGLFASGEWSELGRENKDYRLGNVGYVMTLLWTAVAWQAVSVGCIGLIFKVSALFTNVIAMFSLPVAPVAAVFIFHDKMDGVKVMSMVLAVWGFASYIYQHYLDEKMKTDEKKITNDISLVEKGSLA
ncbi:hypothetical protein Leryth_018048 [Lithospermum erythrorhizon]|uniref:Probable purine permease n=1 Tax=Lithospermum erythrorhizon TaxID=34254 RepID=A0AAV3R4W9_LITER|nr:hypothetical protein Leryth_018048 [Lithospermum erythrorhizon]